MFNKKYTVSSVSFVCSLWERGKFKFSILFAERGRGKIKEDIYHKGMCVTRWEINVAGTKILWINSVGYETYFGENHRRLFFFLFFVFFSFFLFLFLMLSFFCPSWRWRSVLRMTRSATFYSRVPSLVIPWRDKRPRSHTLFIKKFF